MKIDYAMRITALKKYQPSSEEIRAAIMDLIRAKVDADPNPPTSGGFSLDLTDNPPLDATITEARRRANLLQVRLGKLTITAAKNLKTRNFSNADIAKILGIKESSVRSALERAKNRKKS